MEYPKRKKIKGHESFDNVIGAFCTNLIKIVNNIKPEEMTNGKVFLCAISRKTPRLLDMVKPQLSSIWDKLYIFTEIALPFIKWSDIKTIILMDDAIYFGSTFSYYYNLIKSYNDNINIIPICCVKASEASLSFENNLKASIQPRVYGHYFVKSLAECFCEEYTPFEIEFPALEIELPYNSPQDISNFYAELYNRTKKTYKITAIEIDQDGRGCFEFGWNIGSTSELRKIRFYIRGNRLTISSITAYDISQEDLDGTIEWRNTECLKIWNLVKNDISTLYDDRGKDNAYYRVLCIWYNYICSILAFLEKRNILDDALNKIFGMTEISFSVKRNTLEQVIGTKNAAEAYSIINNMLSEDIVEKKGTNFVSTVHKLREQELLPSKFEYEDYYYAMQKKYIAQCQGNLEEELTSLIYLQCVMIDKMNRDFIVLDNERLKYGHTFSSIKNVLTLYSKAPRQQDFLKIHAWVDKYIDRATIVPQYITVNTENNGKIWVRAMRSGENEHDFIGNWCRFYLYYLNKLTIHIGYNKLDKRLFENLISWVFDKYQLGNYCEENIFIKYKDSSFQLCTTIDNEDVSITERMEKLFLIKITDDYISTNKDLLDQELKEGLVLPNTITNQINQSLISLVNWNNKFEDSFPAYLFLNLYFKEHVDAPKSKQKQNSIKLSDKVKKLINFMIEEKLVLSDSISHMMDSLYTCYLRNQYNQISLQKNLQEIPKEEDALKAEVQDHDSKLLASNSIVFLNMLSDIIVTKDLSKAKEDIEGYPLLSPIKTMIDECKGTKKVKAIMLLDKLLNSEIIYELFDR